VLSDDNEVLWLNPVAERLLGLRSPQDIGLQITHLVRHPAFVGFLNQERFEDSVELPSPTNDEVLLSAHITPYGKRRRLMLVEDITQVRRLEQMRRDFVANVSHELRTPLTVINGYLETFLDSGDDCCRPWRQPMQRMHEQTERMLNLIEDLLILSRLETDGAQRHEHPVPVPELLHSVAEDAINLSAQSGHEIRVEADSELWLLGCESELHSAFSNLVFNAVRHTPNRGEVVIRWHADDGGLHLEVQDDGEGIPATHIPRLTERFYRVDRGRSRNCGGTGLGLAIVKHVLNRHDGRLRITSEVGAGSTFSCDFPVQRRLRRELASAANQ
jgi:two-component system phosphate regulon sensor histidine kinase PhoR